MRRIRLLTLAVLLVVCVIQPAAMLSQDNSAKETYDGLPLCQNRRGVFAHPTYQPAPDYDVTTEGRTADIKVVKSLTPGLDQQAIKSVSRWRFDPVVQDGQACPMRVNVQVQFKLY
jgi:TonB family protein